MRGVEATDLVTPDSGITAADIQPYLYPSNDEIEAVGMRGIYLSNFIDWDAKRQAELVIDRYQFAPIDRRRERTFSLYSKTDDHANDVHDYMKYLKFGYGRATDDASTEIRHRRMTREEGQALVRAYDHVRPRTLDTYLDFLGMSEREFEECLAPMRDPDIWERHAGGWRVRDSVVNDKGRAEVERARAPLAEDRTFHPRNRSLYWNDAAPLPAPAQTAAGRHDGDRFIIL
jgi:hypothetical protein